MFTPSLMAMMLHSVWADLPMLRPPREHPTRRHIADDIDELVRRHSDSPRPMPQVPVTGYARRPGELGQAATVAPAFDAPFARPPALFGRIPVDVLSRRLLVAHSTDVRDEYLDLGTPLCDAHRTTMAEADLRRCKRLMGVRPAGAQTRLLVGLIDRGYYKPGSSPDDFNGRVTHLSTADVVFSQHAADVFETLLARLDHHHLVQDVDFVTALVHEPANPIGRSSFQHANVVELHDAVSRLAAHVQSVPPIPMVANLSMGTHVGDHRGDTPMELDIAQRLRFADDRLFVCSAGNDGLSSVSAVLDLQAGVEDHLRLRTGPSGCSELLIEVWWEEPPGHHTLEATVTLRDLRGARATLPLKVNSQVAGSSMKQAGPGFKSVLCESLYHAQCQGAMHCLAVAFSTAHDADLADLTIDITLLVGHDAQVRGWVVLPGAAACGFVGARPAGSVTMPSTFADALSVAAMDNGQPWKESSRGDPGRHGKPNLAHLVDSVGSPQKGTSFAAPRAAADVVERFLRSAATTRAPLAVARFANIDALTQSVLAQHGVRHAFWNARTGHGAIVKGP